MTVRYLIELPWPDKKLSANWAKKIHWAQKAKLIKGARQAAAWNAVSQGVKKIRARKLKVTITLHPPDNRRRDPPNWQYACKAHIDGVADVVQVDDHYWKITWVDGDPIPKDGKIVMELEA